MNYIDVFDVLPEDVEFDFENYRNDEQTVLTPALIKQGYRLRGDWYTSDGDSWGPLVRSVRAVNHNGENVILCYG